MQSILTICKKDIRVWLRHPLTIVSSLLVPLTYFLVVLLAAQATGTNPVALVNEDGGPVSAQVIQAVEQANVFRVQMVDAAQARRLYDQLNVAAILTIPAGFSQKVETGQPATIEMQANNFNADLADDLYRAVPDALTVYYQQLPASPLLISVEEHDMRPQTIQLFQYSILPILILIVTVNGIILAGMGTTREWEEKTIKELLLAPCPPWAIIAGKTLASVVTTVFIAMALLVLGALFGLIPLTGLYWLSAFAIVVLSSLLSSGVGVALGALYQRKQVVSYASTIAAVWLFSLAGGVGIVFFEPEWLQAIAAFDPLLYAIHGLQQAVFYSSFDQFARDCAVLALTALVAVSIGSLAMGRGIRER